MTTTPPPSPRPLAVPALLLLALLACGSDPSSTGEDTTSSASTSGPTSADTAESTGAPPVTCGTSTDEANTDAQIASLEGCEVYLGKLTLLADVSTLAPLASLRVLHGELFLGGTNSPLVDLQGLEQLESVGAFTITSHNLPNLLPLGNLQAVDGNFTIFSVFNLVDLRGLERLRTIGGRFELTANPVLTSVDGLDALEVVGGNFDAQSFMTPLPRSELQALIDRIQIGSTINID